MKKLIFLIFFLITTGIYSQYSLSIYLHSAGTPVTGEAADMDFTKYPHSFPGDVVSGITVTEIGTSGSYVAKGFTTYQYVKLWVDGVNQTWFDSVQAGDPKTYFIALTGNQTITGIKTFSSSPVIPAATSTGQAMRWDEAVNITDGQNVGGVKVFGDIPRLDPGRTYSGWDYELVDVAYLVENYGTGEGSPYPILTNRIYVDAKQTTDVTGKIYNGIQEAITYASTQTPSSTSRWVIIIMPHPGAGYAEDITLVRFVDLIGWGGDVYITGGLTTTHITTAQTWTARDARIYNLTFNTTDESIFLRLVHARDCTFKANGAGGEVTFYIDGSQLRDCGIYTQNDVDLQANATEQENRVKGCFGNEVISWEASDVIYSFDYNTGDQWEY